MRYLPQLCAYAEGNLIPAKQGIYGDSQRFTAANGRYGILNTCNKWTAKAGKRGTDYNLR